MSRTTPETLLKPKLLAVSVAACFALNAAPLRANPTGPSVVHGSVGFNGLGTSALTITNQAGGNAIINWNGFSIGLNELTRFQQFANLAVLNRVTGADISSILGSLQSDGRVFLINPNGIVFGSSARIDVAGLVASSLSLSDQDFLSGRLRFTEVPGAGAVVNNGIIQTAAGERVYLVAPTVENNGLIQSPQGAIVLAAGKEVELVDAASPFVTVKVAAAEQAVNVGSLVADSGQIGMFGALVRNAGVVQAGAAVAGPGGEIRLVAAKDLNVEAGSVVSANGTSGGKVLLQAEGGTNLIGGTVEARGSSGRGGEVSALGVRVGVVGHGVIDASGDNGGGTVLVGGDYQGGNPGVQNAERTYIGSDGVIRADAMTTGDGGRVVAWADGDTRFYGSISAKGGSQSGNGGLVETSGKGSLQAFGQVDTSAASGTGGTWLLDPLFVSIVSGVGANDGDIAYGGGLLAFATPPNPGTSQISVAAIDAGVGSNSVVTVQAIQDVSFLTNVSLSNEGDFAVHAGDNIKLGAFGITTKGNLTLSANDAGALIYGAVPTTGAITSSAGGGNLATNGGNVSLSGASVAVGNINTTGPIGGELGNGNVNISASNGNISTGSITTRSLSPFYDDCGDGCVVDNPAGSIDLFAAYGAITVNGGIDTRGADGVSGYDNGLGSASGYVEIYAGGAVGITGAINTSGANGAAGDNSAYGWGGAGRQAGYIDVSGASVSTAGITARGGNGGNGGSFSDSGSYGGYSINVNGGDAGDGGNVYLYASNGAAVVGGTLDTTGGAGGNGGTGSISATGTGISGYVYADGGSGGESGGINVSGQSVSTQAIVARGGSGGNGGSATVTLDGADASAGAEAQGGYTYSFGYVSLYATGSISTGTIDTRGGSGGSGGTATARITNAGGSASAYAYAYGADGGEGSSLNLYSDTGSIVAGNVTTIGGNGGAGGSATASITGPATSVGSTYSGASGGYGYYGGSVGMYADAGSVTTGSIDARGGNGGNGGSASTTVSGVNGTIGSTWAEASGGGGNQSYYYYQGRGIELSGQTVVAGNLVTLGGAGGSGGNATTSVSGALSNVNAYAYANGGSGGSGYEVWLDASLGITAGQIDTRGGNGGGAGNASVSVSGASGTVNTYSSANGGSGYYGGMVQLAASGPISVGSIVTLGGNGANGGSASIGGGTPGASPYAVAHGGSGYYGGDVYVDTSGSVTTGSILTRGGNGGNAGVTSGSIYASNGGYGDDGGHVYVYGSVVKINLGGTLGATAIDTRGGLGGAGAAAASPAGSGGGGGAGGSVDVFGNPEITFFGVVNASGGAGGAGGAGNALNPGGGGGSGGNAGFIYADAGASENTIFVITPVFGVAGGAQGAGGADGGAGAGSAGSFGLGDVTYFSHVGKIVVLDPLAIPEVNQAAQQTAGEGATAFVGGEKEEEEEDKSQKELGSCKG